MAVRVEASSSQFIRTSTNVGESLTGTTMFRGAGSVPVNGPAAAMPEEASVNVRLDKIVALDDGWWGPGSRAVSEEAVRIVRNALEGQHTFAAAVAIGPLPSGSLMLEWTRGENVYTAELALDGQMELTTDNTHTDEFSSRTISFSEPELRQFLIRS